MARTAGELIDDLIGKGLTQTEIADALGRDQSLISQVRRGKKPGSNLVETLQELSEKGTATRQPARRQTKAGTARVRGKAGSPGVVPPQPGNAGGKRVSRRVEVPKRGTFSKETTYGRQSRKHTIRFPRTKGSKGKERAWEETGKAMKSLARKKWGDKDLPERRVQITMTYEDGAKVDIGSKGGYRPEAILAGLNDSGGNVESWVDSQGVKNRYEDLNPNARMVSIDITGTVR